MMLKKREKNIPKMAGYTTRQLRKMQEDAQKWETHYDELATKYRLLKTEVDAELYRREKEQEKATP